MKKKLGKDKLGVPVAIIGISLLCWIIVIIWHGTRISSLETEIHDAKASLGEREERISEDVRMQIEALYVPYGPKEVAWWTSAGNGFSTVTERQSKICPQDAIQKILDHLGLEFEKTESVSRVVLVKKGGKQ